MELTGIVAEKGFHAFDREPRTHAGHEVPRIWIVVADRIKAYVYRRTATDIELIANAKSSGKKPRAEGVHKNSGHIAGTHTHYCSDPRDRENHHDDRQFILSLSAWLDEAERSKAFDRLVLVAAPRTLGALRTTLNGAVSARIIAEVNKELTKMPAAEIHKSLGEIMAF